MTNTLITLAFGLCMGLLCAACVIAGAWIAFRIRKDPENSGQGFFKDGKGDAFVIPDDADIQSFPGTEEPSEDQKRILDRVNGFLERMNNDR